MTEPMDLGTWFGYPQCCIDSFNEMRHIGCLPEHELVGTGYIPCVECAELYTADELRAVIAEYRKCPTPFPEADGVEHLPPGYYHE